MSRELLFVTGATGLIGARALARLLRANPELGARVLVRDPAGWVAAAASLGTDAARVEPVVGDLRAPGLGLDAGDRERAGRGVVAVLHAAAATSFSQTLEAARAVNVEGTRRLLEVAAGWPDLRRVAFVSTAFVAGCRTGTVYEDDAPTGAGWVNAYERSKAEAEQAVRDWGRDEGREWTILRSSTVVCDSVEGEVTQVNAVHRALRLYYGGLAPMLPGTPATTIDVVPADYVAHAIAALSLAPGAAGVAYHLCAGDGAMPLGELLDATHDAWRLAPAWRRRAVARPAVTDLATYRLFERSVEETGDRRLRQVVASLSHFVPQLAHPKRFDTTNADHALGRAAPPVRDYWRNVVARLADGRTGDAMPRTLHMLGEVA
jgi:nucleoside-diphosphate-sugar epimerase